MDYKKIFSPNTLQKLNKKSAENLKTMLGDKNLMQTLMSSQQLLSEIIEAEAPYKSQLEKLAVDMVKELYPIIDEEGIVLDAKLVGMSDVNKSLDEIKVNNPNVTPEKVLKFLKDNNLIPDPNQNYNPLTDRVIDILNSLYKGEYKWDPVEEKIEQLNQSDLNLFYNSIVKLSNKLQESISPEGRRRIINSITQGSALRGAFAFYLFKEHLDEIDPSLVEKYNQIMKEVFGIYDDPNAIAMMLSMLAQGQKMAGGSSKVIIKEIKVNDPTEIIKKIRELASDPFYISASGIWDLPLEDRIKYLRDNFSDEDIRQEWEYAGLNKKPLNESEQSGITIKARAICFPMLVHELIKGLYELVSLQGFKGDKATNQAVVDKVDKLEHEPSDIRFGKFIYDALNDLFAKSKYNNPKIREFFFIEIYKLDDNDFISLIENSINENLTQEEKNWVEKTLKEIDDDLKADEADKYIDENLLKV